MSAHSNIELLAEQIILALKPELVSISTNELRQQLLERLSDYHQPLEVMVGQEGLQAIATISSSHILMIAVVGSLRSGTTY